MRHLNTNHQRLWNTKYVRCFVLRHASCWLYTRLSLLFNVASGPSITFRVAFKKNVVKPCKITIHAAYGSKTLEPKSLSMHFQDVLLQQPRSSHRLYLVDMSSLSAKKTGLSLERHLPDVWRVSPSRKPQMCRWDTETFYGEWNLCDFGGMYGIILWFFCVRNS